MSGQRQEPQSLSKGDALAIIHFGADALGKGVLPFICTDCGREVPGMGGFVVFIFMLLLAGAQNSRAMLIYVALWFIALVIQRIHTMRLLSQGAKIHSRSWQPWLAYKLPFVKPYRAATIAEPVMCLVIGWLLCEVSDTLGKFIMAAGGGLIVRMVLEELVYRKRLQVMADAMIEQEYYSERFQSGS
jgi:hypothetical protein